MKGVRAKPSQYKRDCTSNKDAVKQEKIQASVHSHLIAITVFLAVGFEETQDVISGELLLRDQALLWVVLQLLRLPNELGKQGQVPIFAHLQVLEEAFEGGVG